MIESMSELLENRESRSTAGFNPRRRPIAWQSVDKLGFPGVEGIEEGELIVLARGREGNPGLIGIYAAWP